MYRARCARCLIEQWMPVPCRAVAIAKAEGMTALLKEPLRMRSLYMTKYKLTFVMGCGII